MDLVGSDDQNDSFEGQSSLRAGKSVKQGVHLLRGLFDLENGSFWPLGLNGSRTKVLTNVYKKFWRNDIGITNHQKFMN